MTGVFEENILCMFQCFMWFLKIITNLVVGETNIIEILLILIKAVDIFYFCFYLFFSIGFMLLSVGG